MFRTFFICAATIFGATACHASESYYYRQTETGEWISLTEYSQTNNAMAEAKVVCNEGGGVFATITWYSESGDWTAYDTYQTHDKPLFTRIIKFAQYPIEVRVTIEGSGSSPKITYVGAEGVNKEDLPEVVDIVSYGRHTPFPFSLPNCAKELNKQ
jgi:hypothetical protein